MVRLRRHRIYCPDVSSNRLISRKKPFKACLCCINMIEWIQTGREIHKIKRQIFAHKNWKKKPLFPNRRQLRWKFSTRHFGGHFFSVNKGHWKANNKQKHKRKREKKEKKKPKKKKKKMQCKKPTYVRLVFSFQSLKILLCAHASNIMSFPMLQTCLKIRLQFAKIMVWRKRLQL